MFSRTLLLSTTVALVAMQPSVAANNASTKALQNAAQLSTQVANSSGNPNTEERELQIAISLVDAGLPLAALKEFEKIISAGRSHSQYQNAINALAKLAVQKEIEPLLAQLLMRVYEKDASFIEGLDNDSRQNVKFILANRLFKTGKTVQARTLAESIDPKQSRYAAARYLLALDDLKLRASNDTPKNYSSAITNFEEVRKTIPSSVAKTDLFNLRNMATLGIARAYYEQGYSLAEDNPNRRNFSKKAIEFYREIPRFSAAWDDALFEMGWAYTIAEEYGDALGAIRSLAHPYFANAYYPEAEILSAIVYWYNCQWDRATRALKNWNNKYLPLEKAIQDAVAAKNGTKEWNDFSGFPEMLAQRIKKDPQYSVFDALINSMKQERDIIAKDEFFKSSALAQQLNDYYAKATAELKKTAKSWSEQSLKDMLSELESVQTRASIISLETKTAETQWLEHGRQITGLKRSRLARPYIPVDRDQFWWVSNSESWKDELGFYRLSIKSECYE